jgi:hypothetical protein
VLDLLEDDLTEELAPWYPGRDEFATEVVGQALGRFDKAFNRWRDLFLAAEQQRDAAHRTESDYSAPPAEKKAAKSRYLQARDQLELLQKGTSSQSSDFYTYRYLATEGFLPGYNFPRLPLMAYVPATNDGRGRQTYLQRPRFLRSRSSARAASSTTRAGPTASCARCSRSAIRGAPRPTRGYRRSRCASARAAALATSTTRPRCATPAALRSATPRS